MKLCSWTLLRRSAQRATSRRMLTQCKKKKSAHGCIPIFSPLSLAIGGCLPRASRRTVFGPRTYQVPRIIVHLQFLGLSHAWLFFWCSRNHCLGNAYVCLRMTESQARSMVSGPRIVLMTLLSPPRNWSRTVSLVHTFFPLQKMIEMKNRCWSKASLIRQSIDDCAYVDRAANAVGTKAQDRTREAFERNTWFLATRSRQARPQSHGSNSQAVDVPSSPCLRCQLQYSQCVRALDEMPYCDTGAARATMNPKRVQTTTTQFDVFGCRGALCKQKPQAR